MSSYSSMFRVKRVYTNDLRNNKEFLDNLIAQGFKYIRRHDERAFYQLLRDPILGCKVEVYQIPYHGTVPIDSPAGKKIINRICYF